MNSKTIALAASLISNYVYADTLTLNASNANNTYSHIKKILGPTAVNDIADDCSHVERLERHINTVFDDELNKNVFEILAHTDDVDCQKESTDRTRTEIKIDGSSLLSIHEENEHSEWRWLFKVPEDFFPTGSFTHIFQAKAEYKEKQPRLRLSIYNKNNEESLELNYANDDNTFENLTKIKGLDFITLKGKWLEVHCIVTWGNDGDIQFTIKKWGENEIVMDYRNDHIDLWNEHWDYIRPKFGIYRGYSDSVGLTNVSLRLSDIQLTKGDHQGVVTEDSDGLKMHLPAVIFQNQSLWAEFYSSNGNEWYVSDYGLNSTQVPFVAELGDNLNLLVNNIRFNDVSLSAEFIPMIKNDSIYWVLQNYKVLSSF